MGGGSLGSARAPILLSLSKVGLLRRCSFPERNGCVFSPQPALFTSCGTAAVRTLHLQHPFQSLEKEGRNIDDEILVQNEIEKEREKMLFPRGGGSGSKHFISPFVLPSESSGLCGSKIWKMLNVIPLVCHPSPLNKRQNVPYMFIRF